MFSLAYSFHAVFLLVETSSLHAVCLFGGRLIIPCRLSVGGERNGEKDIFQFPSLLSEHFLAF